MDVNVLTMVKLFWTEHTISDSGISKTVRLEPRGAVGTFVG